MKWSDLIAIDARALQVYNLNLINFSVVQTNVFRGCEITRAWKQPKDQSFHQFYNTFDCFFAASSLIHAHRWHPHEISQCLVKFEILCYTRGNPRVAFNFNEQAEAFLVIETDNLHIYTLHKHHLFRDLIASLHADKFCYFKYLINFCNCLKT